MPILAYEPERLAALHRAVDDLVDALSRFRSAIPPSMADLWGSIQRDMALSRAQQEAIEGVLRSDIGRLGHWSGSATLLVDVWRAQQARNQVLTWVDTHPSWWAKATHGHPTDIDATVQALLTNPQTAARFIDSLDDVAPIIFGAHDTDLIRDLWLLVTDPNTTSVEDAGRRIRSLLTTIAAHPEQRSGLSRSSIDSIELQRIEQSALDMLGRILAPWQFHFSGLAAAWSWPVATGIDWLKFAATSSRAAADLASGLGPSVIRSLSQLPDSPAERRQHIDDVAFSIGVSLEVLHQAGEVQAGRDRASWQSIDDLIEFAPVNAPWPLSILIGRGASWLDEQVLTRKESVSERSERLRATLTSQQVMAGLAVLTVWRSHWRNPVRSALSPQNQERELRHTYDAIDAPSARGRVLAR